MFLTYAVIALALVRETVPCSKQKGQLSAEDSESVIGACPRHVSTSFSSKYPENFRYKTLEEVKDKIRNNPTELELGDWKRVLTPDQFKVTRLNCTEKRNSSPLNNVKGNGKFQCASCGNALFDKVAKYNSGTGWPSFYKVIRPNAVKELTDYDIGYARTEIRCGRCGAHLGHMFNDGPPPTGLRYCMNGVAMDFLTEPSP